MENCKSLEKTQDCVQVTTAVSDFEQAPFVYYYGRKIRVIQKIVKISKVTTLALNQLTFCNDLKKRRKSIPLSTEGQLLASLLRSRVQEKQQEVQPEQP